MEFDKQTGSTCVGKAFKFGRPGRIGPGLSNITLSLFNFLSPYFSQLAAQVLEDLNDEDIGFGLVDEKKDSAVAKKLGKCFW